MKENSSRREFLKVLGVAGLGATAVCAVPLAAEAARFSARDGGKLYKTSQTRMLMGTFVSVTTVTGSKEMGQEAVGRAFQEMKRLIAVFDRYDGSTPLSVLNGQGRLKGAPAELVEVVGRSLSLYGASAGAFDVTVAPLVDLFKRSGGNGPGKAELREAMELADADSLRVKPGEISFAKSGMRLTLDGIAKGYVVDKASEALTAMGVHNHLINAGGDIRCSGERGSGRPWTVAVQDPRKQGNYPDVLRVRNCAMATSGNYEVSPDDGEPRRHLVSPETGLFPDALASATVTAPTVMEADALSTSLGVMRLDKGLEFIYSLPGRDCLVIAPSGETVRSRGWNSGA